ncbi:MAG: response regulator transcription factor [Gammaproteobacteria bacterium]
MMRGLVVEDDVLHAQALKRALERRGMSIAVAHDSAGALNAARADPPEFVLLDLKLGTESGLTLIEPLLALRTDTRIVVLTGYASIATTVEAIKRGAHDYLPKPATAEQILRALDAPQESAPTAAPDVMLPLQRLEWEHIQQALKDCGGNVSAAARLLGMHRRSLQRKLSKRPAAQRPGGPAGAG